MRFSSRKDITMSLLIWIPIFLCLGTIYATITTQISILTILLMLAIIVLFSSFWFNTHYTIKKKHVKISYGPITKRILISEITAIRKTKNPFTAPALSMKRIELTYDNYHTIQISPKETQRFIRELTRRNSEIQVDAALFK